MKVPKSTELSFSMSRSYIRLLAEVGNRQQATGNRVRDFKEKRAKKDFTSDFCKRSIELMRGNICGNSLLNGGTYSKFDLKIDLVKAAEVQTEEAPRYPTCVRRAFWRSIKKISAFSPSETRFPGNT
ncbi:MAG: hypothetical protein SXA11_20230 [Cyanobacteriota bacterium]|nr:hypothetical protein [Cyanobacteriota bacterium]